MTGADAIATLCYDHYRLLPPRGKPKTGEWTVMAAFVLRRESMLSSGMTEELSVVSMGTGTKCLGRNALHPRGFLLHDSHAEVIARRAFLRYLYEQLENALSKNGDSIFHAEPDGLCTLKAGVKFIFFSSRSPCGDASICSASVNKSNRKRQHETVLDESDSKMQKHSDTAEVFSSASTDRAGRESAVYSDKTYPVEDLLLGCDQSRNQCSESHARDCSNPACLPVMSADFPGHFTVGTLNFADKGRYGILGKNGAATCGCSGTAITGAKHVDPLATDALEQSVGALRTKPGRGDRTLSMSCSDKIAKWLVLGCQGALLSLLLPEPVPISCIVVAGRSSCVAAARRAFSRGLTCSNNGNELAKTPSVLQSTLVFCHDHSDAIMAAGDKDRSDMAIRSVPSTRALIWCRTKEHDTEVSVDGHREGVTKKNRENPKSRLTICRQELFQRFQKLLLMIDGATELANKLRHLHGASYFKCKMSAEQYQVNWLNLRKKTFQLWTTKPADYMQFHIAN